ncbi:MAG: cupredoxin domain-containing protein, partial [Thermomicrobiales bacterium]
MICRRPMGRGLPRLSLLLALVALLIPGSTAVASAQGTPAAEVSGAPLAPEAIAELFAVFDDEAVTGGQVMPRIAKFVNPNVFVFLQFDAPTAEEATALRYIGVGVKSVFCAETRPDLSFTHFHKYEAAEYGEGHGSQPGDQGYWLTWVAVDPFEARDGRQVMPGVDYEFSPTPPTSCGDSVPDPSFNPPDAADLTSEEIQELAALFSDPVLTGGQVAPRLSKWTSETNFIFAQFDDRDPAAATALPYVGIGVKGIFCTENLPSRDFPHYHRVVAPEYGEGHGGDPSESEGYWLLWVATDSFESRDGRQITPGVDREFALIPAPACGGAPEGSPVVSSASAMTVSATEWAFDPSELRGAAGEHITIAVTNTGEQFHTFTIPGLDVDTGSLSPGASTTLDVHLPAEAGTHELLCTFPDHAEAGMVGT